MEIYIASADFDKYDSLVLPPGRNYEIFSRLLEKPVIKTWEPVDVVINKAEERGDFLYLIVESLVCTAKALKLLSPLIKGSIEALPLKCGTKKYYAMHILELLDCIDYSRATVARFDDGGLMEIEKFAFRKEIIRGKHIFKVREFPLGYVLVSEKFKKTVEENKLKGLLFSKVS